MFPSITAYLVIKLDANTDKQWTAQQILESTNRFQRFWTHERRFFGRWIPVTIHFTDTDDQSLNPWSACISLDSARLVDSAWANSVLLHNTPC